MGLYSDKCKRCGIRYGNQAVRGANTPAGREGMCAPCWQTVFEERQAAQRRPEVPKPPPVTTAPPVMVADELGKLAKLRDAGVLTNEEFDAQKSLLLGTSAKPVVPPINFEIPRFPEHQAGNYDVILIKDNGNVQFLRNAGVDWGTLTVPQTNALVQNVPIAFRKGGSIKAANSLASLMRSAWGMEVEVRRSAGAQPEEPKNDHGPLQDSPNNPPAPLTDDTRTWSDIVDWRSQPTAIKVLFIIAVGWLTFAVFSALASMA